jgi:hypothetical protein
MVRIGSALQIAQQKGDVRVGVAAFACVAGRVHAGRAAEGFDLEARVFRKAIVAVFFLHVAGLEERIAFERVGSFFDFFVAADVLERADFEAGAEDALDFAGFVGVVGGKNEGRH